MNFTSYPLWLSQPDFKSWGGNGRLDERYNNAAFEACRAYMERGEDEHAKERQATVEILLLERRWLASKRPFYHVYPAVSECLSRTKLDFTLPQLGINIEPTALCFAVGHEPMMCGCKLQACIVTLDQDTYNITTGGLMGVPTLAIACHRVRDDRKPGWTLLRYNATDRQLSDVSQHESAEKMAVVRLAIGVAMLAADERYCEPLLMQRDERRGLAGKERLAAVERARRRGVVGFSIGKGIEMSPHVRRPHFGIRWTEKGRSVPKLVPISGSVVAKKLLYPIPTGMSGPAD